MYTSIRRYSVDPEAMDDLLHRIDTEFAEQVQGMDGFVAYECLDCGDGQLVTISMFRNREGCDASAEAAAGWVREELSDYRVERTDVMVGEVGVSRARETILEPAHH